MFSFHWPGPPAHGVSDRLLTCHRREPIYLGRFRWGGHTGTLVLWPGYPAGGEDGDHLIYRWRARGVDYAFSLHSWAPLAVAVATLRAVVVSS